MPQDQVRSLLDSAKKKMNKGIYALQEGDKVEFVNMPMSTTQIKKFRREAKKIGIKVYANM